jgi:hypothetical protein
MLQWNDGSWEHRAYWGANSLDYGIDGTPTRRYMGALPAPGQWVQLKVPASQVNLEGSILNGMAFTLYNGRATWDAAGRLSQVSGTVGVSATQPNAFRVGLIPGLYTISRTGDTNSSLQVSYSLGGTATAGIDYVLPPGGATSLTIPAGASSAALSIVPLASTNFVGPETVVMTLVTNSNYSLSAAETATISLLGNSVKVQSIQAAGSAVTMTWASISNHTYRIGYKNNLTDPTWLTGADILATNTTSTWRDTNVLSSKQRFYLIAQTN